MNKDDMSDDAQFDAFLKGEGDLARSLQGLAQPAPSAGLDAAILAAARASMAQDARPVAANDSAAHDAAPRLAPGLGWRWRMPAGIAAAVLVGVFAKQSFEASGDMSAVVMPAPASEPAAAPSAAPVMRLPENDRAPAAAAAPPADVQRPAAAPRAESKPAPERAKAVPPRAEPAPVTVQEAAAPAPQVKSAPPKLMQDKAEEKIIANEYLREEQRAPAKLHYNAPAPPPLMPAPAPAADMATPVAQATSAPSGRVVVSARANRKSDASSNAAAIERAPSAAAAAPVGPMAESAWLDRIEKLLEQGQQAEAVANWKAFREVYPHYPVPDATRAKLEK